MTTPTTAVERSDKNRAVSVITIIQNKTGALIADWDDQLLNAIAKEFTRCRREAVAEVEGLIQQYDESPDDMAGFEIRIKKPVEFRTKLKQLKGE